jgi:hypothetical protein
VVWCGRHKTSIARLTSLASPLLGDRGSGYQIGYEILNAVVRALDGRGPATSLVEAVLTKLNLSKARTNPPHFQPIHAVLISLLRVSCVVCRVSRVVCVRVVSCAQNRARS